ncbi:MAG: DUF4314 domain-containing protein [Aeriscardovia sp.]|nr:DUF4314 domain-containing protein [Aeriscardovia sp.]
MNKALEEARKKYPKGVVLELTADMDDPYNPKRAGDRFLVEYIDDAGNIHGKWCSPASGSLCLILGVDHFMVVKEVADDI